MCGVRPKSDEVGAKGVINVMWISPFEECSSCQKALITQLVNLIYSITN